jgi:hypothetical protein
LTAGKVPGFVGGVNIVYGRLENLEGRCRFCHKSFSFVFQITLT